MKAKLYSLTGLLILGLNYTAFCDNYVSIANGSWTSKSKWDVNKAPDDEIEDDDSVFIYHDISFNKDLEIEGVVIIYSTGSLENSGHKDIEVKSGGYLKVYGDIECEDLEVESGGVVDCYGSILINDDYENSGTVNILSTSSYIGNLTILGSKKNNASVTITRYVKKDGWHYISAPMTGVKMNKFWGGAVYSYDEPSKTWDSHKANETMVPLKGYDVYFKSNHHYVTFKGTPNDSAVSINLTYTSSTGDGYNMVGNPYCSAINWDASSGWTKTNINDAIYVWDDSLQNVATYISSVGTNGGTNIIPPTMAFFVKCNSNSGGYLSVNKNAQVSNMQNFRAAPSNNTFRFRVGNEQYYDETAIKFDNQASSNFDDLFDAEKMFSYNLQVPQCYTQTLNGDMLSVNSLPKPMNNIEIPLYIRIQSSGFYKFEMYKTDFDFDVTVLLEDLQTGETVDLMAKDYEFYSDFVSGQERFIIHVIPNLTIAAGNNMTTDINENEIKKPDVYVRGRSLYVHFNEISDNAAITIVNVNGQVIKESFIKNPDTYRMDLPDPDKTAAYIVIINRDGILTEEKILVRP